MLCLRSLRLVRGPGSARSFMGMFGETDPLKKYNNPNAVTVYKNPDLPAVTGVPRLRELSLKGVAEYMKTEQCQNVLVLSGYGLSTAAGIPHYRKMGGLEARKLVGDKGWDQKKDAENLWYLEQYMFMPYGFFRFMQKLWPGNYRPTLAHYFVRTLQDKGMLLRQWTENTDNLEKMCGIRDEKLVEYMGTWMRFECMNTDCRTEYNLDWIKDKLDSYRLPNCDNCYDKTRPAVLFWDDEISIEDNQASIDAANADLVICLGTDLQTMPFAKIPHMVPKDVPRLVIHEKDIEMDMDDWEMNVLFDFDSDLAYRDVFWEGSTDLGILSLCSYLGWDSDVRQILNEETLSMPTRRDVQQRLGLLKPLNPHGIH